MDTLLIIFGAMMVFGIGFFIGYAMGKSDGTIIKY